MSMGLPLSPVRDRCGYCCPCPRARHGCSRSATHRHLPAPAPTAAGGPRWRTDEGGRRHAKGDSWRVVDTEAQCEHSEALLSRFARRCLLPLSSWRASASALPLAQVLYGSIVGTVIHWTRRRAESDGHGEPGPRPGCRARRPPTATATTPFRTCRKAPTTCRLPRPASRRTSAAAASASRSTRRPASTATIQVGTAEATK